MTKVQCTGGASWDEPLSIISTLYKAEGQGFREKAAKFVLRGLNDSASTSSGTALASGKIDLAVIPYLPARLCVLDFARARAQIRLTPHKDVGADETSENLISSMLVPSSRSAKFILYLCIVKQQDVGADETSRSVNGTSLSLSCPLPPPSARARALSLLHIITTTHMQHPHAMRQWN